MANAVTFVSDKQFKEAIKDNADNGKTLGVHKGFSCQVKIVDTKRRLIDFVISTECVDRMWDKICVKGWEVENYMANPVVLFGHDHRSPPIAKTISLEKRPVKKCLEARAEFMDRDVYPFADMIFNMYVKGFMKATSVGFRPLEYKMCDDDDERKMHYGIDFIRQELLEYSAVSVPANPEALIDAKAKGIDLSPLRGWAEQVLDEYEEHTKGGLMIPRKTLEQMRKHSEQSGKRPTLVLDPVRRAELARENLLRLQAVNQKLADKAGIEKEVDESVDQANEDITMTVTADLTDKIEVAGDITLSVLDEDLENEVEIGENLPSEEASAEIQTPEAETEETVLDVAKKTDIETLEDVKETTDPVTVELDDLIKEAEEDFVKEEEFTLDEIINYIKLDKISEFEDLLEFISDVNKNDQAIADSRYIRALRFFEDVLFDLEAEVDSVLSLYDSVEEEDELELDQDIVTTKSVDKDPTLCQDDDDFDLDSFVTDLEKEDTGQDLSDDDFDIDDDLLKEALQDVIKNVVSTEVKKELNKLTGKLD